MHRYTKLNVLRNSNNRRYYKAIKYPNIPPSVNDIYLITSIGDRLDLLAHRYFKDKKLWSIIPTANPDVVKKDSFYLKPGLEIRIPTNITTILNNFEKLNN